MAGKRKRKVKSSDKTTKDQQLAITTKKKEDKGKVRLRFDLPSEQKKDQLELQSWSDLPAELLERVFSPLTLIENVRASAVCKWWNSIAVSTRIVNQPPWLMFFPKRGDIYEFYDPCTRKLYTIELKELSHQRVCCSKNGWLLVSGPRRSAAFFNPFSREMIKLPSLPMICQVAAFSCAPTDPSCVIFAIRHISPSAVTIITWQPGAKMWSMANYQNELPCAGSCWNKWIFSNGLFYCLTVTCWLGVFNPKERTWDVLKVSPPRGMYNFYDEHWWEGRFLAEHNGELLIVYTCCNQNPIILKLDRSALEWERVEFLDDVTLFAGSLSTHTRTDLPGRMRNSIFFSKVRFYGKNCISYSLRDQRYYPRKQSHDWGDEEQYDSIWIDQPRDLSAFIEGR